MYLIHQYPIFIPFIAIFLAEVVKAAIDFICHRKKIRFVNPGGMPSGHSAFVSSMVVAIGYFEGADSTLFMLAVVVALIVMYDAVNLRNESGKHAKFINSMNSKASLEESLGHTKLEVAAGCVFGVLIALALLLY